MKLENFYYTEEYKNHRLKYEILFDKKYFVKEKENKINDSFLIKHKKYLGKIYNKDIIGYERAVFNKDKEIYNYKSDDSRIYKIVKHENQNNYFIFNKDLSGFSILNLNNLKEEINFYNNKFIDDKGILVFVDLEYYHIENGRMIFYVFYLSETENNAYKRIFSRLIYDFSKPNKLDDKNIVLIDIRDIILKKYDKDLNFLYQSYFKDGDIIIENSHKEDFNKKDKFILHPKDYIFN